MSHNNHVFEAPCGVLAIFLFMVPNILIDHNHNGIRKWPDRVRRGRLEYPKYQFRNSLWKVRGIVFLLSQKVSMIWASLQLHFKYSWNLKRILIFLESLPQKPAQHCRKPSRPRLFAKGSKPHALVFFFLVNNVIFFIVMKTSIWMIIERWRSKSLTMKIEGNVINDRDQRPIKVCSS